MTTEHIDAQHGQLVPVPVPDAKDTTVPAGRWARIREAASSTLHEHVLPWMADQAVDFGFWVRYTARPWLRRRGREIENALWGGWPATVGWLRALAYLTGFAALVGIVHSLHPLLHSVGATISQPIHAYLTAHAAGLPIASDMVWALWVAAGPGLFIAAVLGSTTARALWVAYGAAAIAMVWAATPEAGRPVATALAVICWALVSSAALAGLQLRPVLVVPVRVRVNVRPRAAVASTARRFVPGDSQQ